MLLYDLLDTLEPFKEYKIKSVQRMYHFVPFNLLRITQGYSWNGKYGWLYYAYSVLDLGIPATPQNKNIHAEMNSSGQAYTIVYKRWKCLINKIKEDFKNIEVEL
ncbi:MAG: hypothetical protein IIZ67_01355 [Bacilli bacterium]|nr:hypothetical protein [Bacilli bacterium]